MDNYFSLISEIDRDLKTDESFDIIKRELIIAERQAVLYFIDGFIKDEVYEKMLEFLFKIKPEELNDINDMSRFAKDKMPYVETDYSYDVKEIETAILSGPSVLIIDGIYGALTVDTRTYPMRSIDEPRKDKSLRGSRDGFVETLVMNTAMIRRRIRDSRLRMEYMQIGTDTKLDIAISYIDGLADKKTLDILRKRLKEIKVGGISMTQQALSEKLQKSAFFNPFPKFKFTERPDYTSACILDGRIALVMDNSPTVMLIPMSLSDYFRETDDYYFLPISGSYIRTLRIIVSFATVLLTPVYLLLLKYPEIIPDWLLFIVPEALGAIPLVVQFLLLELLVDGLRLASVNTPDTLSNSLGIIGGLLISEFAVNVGWFIPECILFTAFITVSGFSLPSFEMGYAMKFERILLLLLVQFFGFWGFLGGIVFLIFAMLNIKTLSGRCYLYPIIPFKPTAFAELFLRFPMK
ncbi:MAG: spore germination protein [Clostridia bacterium]|nr:spore germination protein [Clostridia bacterium]